MTKFILIIWVCSFATNPTTCLPPMEHPQQFNSWYELFMSRKRQYLTMWQKCVRGSFLPLIPILSLSL